MTIDMKKYILLILSLGFVFGCNDFLAPLPNGSYNEDNYEDYPDLIRGYVEKAYDLLPASYVSTDYIAGDGLADNMTWRSRTNANYRFATGSSLMSNYSHSSIYTRDYKGIYYCNLFLKDDIGKTTKYMLDEKLNAKLQNVLQGDAYALRAWYLYDLLKFFGGRSTDGQMMGVPIFTEPIDPNNADLSDVARPTYEQCVDQIIKDIDSALVYLPAANRDFLKDQELVPITGAVRYRRFDGAGMLALKASVLLTWASPAFNPYDDVSRWDAAAKAAKAAIDHKLLLEGASSVPGGFDPKASFMWKDPNSSEAYCVSQIKNNSTFETNFYPQGFGGSSDYVPTQELVDAFGMANGYPIDHPKSGYDAANPFKNRDPRFYATIFYDGSQVVRNTNASDVMYVFDTAEGGKDAPGLVNTSPTGYYIKKFVYLGWNKSDNTVSTAQSCVMYWRWTQMLITFAEAANQVVGPLDNSTYGMSAKEAVEMIRNRPLEDGTLGVGINGDPYLEEQAVAGAQAFEKLIRSEWRVETCFEGFRFHNVRRWARSVDEINKDLHAIKVVREGIRTTYEVVPLESRRYPSLWLPIPYMEIRKSPLMVQNEGWESWK